MTTILKIAKGAEGRVAALVYVIVSLNEPERDEVIAEIGSWLDDHS